MIWLGDQGLQRNEVVRFVIRKTRKDNGNGTFNNRHCVRKFTFHVNLTKRSDSGRDCQSGEQGDCPRDFVQQHPKSLLSGLIM